MVPCISNLVLNARLVLLQYRLEVGKSGISMDQASLIRGSGISERINVIEWTCCIRIIRAPAFRFFHLVGCQDRCGMPLQCCASCLGTGRACFGNGWMRSVPFAAGVDGCQDRLCFLLDLAQLFKTGMRRCSSWICTCWKLPICSLRSWT